MREEKSNPLMGGEIFSDFLLSDVKLGVFDNELEKVKNPKELELIVFNRLDMILELNKKLIAN